MIAQLSGAFYSIMQNLRYNAAEAGVDADGIKDMKLSLLRDEAESLIQKGLSNPFEVLQALIEADGKVGPIVGESALRAIVARVVQLKSIEIGQRSGEVGTSTLFDAAEKAAREQCRVIPVRIGVPRLDEALGSGLFPGHVLGIVGHEGSLKTSLALHLLESNLWGSKDCRALFVSLDMLPDSLAFRRVSRLLNIHEARAREMAASGDAEYIQAREEISRRDDGRLAILSAPCSISDVEAAVSSFLPTVVLIDYIALLDVPNETDQFRALRKVLQAIRRWRTETKCVFVLLSQMSRASKAEARSGKSGSHSFGGSQFEQLLDCEIELCLDVNPDVETDIPRLVGTVTKSRFGASGKSFELEYLGLAKKITGRAWRLDRAKEQKPAFGQRSQF